jgi:protein transport protein SEC24|tara:strand:+ start:141 stop:689 length:549 start_codon:yes stop_codon:yes gene_type:complete
MPMPSIQLTATKLVSNGCFLLDDGEELLMWIGRGAPPMMLNALFGAEVSSLDGLDAAQVRFCFVTMLRGSLSGIAALLSFSLATHRSRLPTRTYLPPLRHFPQMSLVRLTPEEDARLHHFNSRIHNIIDAIRSTRSLYPQLTVIREGERIEECFRWHLVEDPANFQGGNVSYTDYAQMVGAR